MFLYMDGLHKNASEKTLRISGSVEKVSHGRAMVEELLVNSDMERKEKMLVVSASKILFQGGPAGLSFFFHLHIFSGPKSLICQGSTNQSVCL